MVHNCFTDRDFIYKMKKIVENLFYFYFLSKSIKLIYKIIEKGKF